MAPMKGDDRHPFFCADAKVRIVVEDREKIDVEGRTGPLAHVVDHATELVRRRKADADCANSSATADRQCEVRRCGERHAGTGKGMVAAKPCGKPRSDGVHPLILRSRCSLAKRTCRYRLL